MSIRVRKATISDLEDVIAVVINAKNFLKKQNINQWQTNYPNEQLLNEDINSGNGWVITVDDQVAGYAAVVFGEEKYYKNNRVPEWNNEEATHYSIHRFAISNNFRGQNLSQQFITSIFNFVESENVRDVRIETHPDNRVMQKVIEKNGFIRKGDMDIEEEGISIKMFAYQAMLK
ncbi:GNAT family N-acetyltransferase [Leuconostoc citreum]